MGRWAALANLCVCLLVVATWRQPGTPAEGRAAWGRAAPGVGAGLPTLPPEPINWTNAGPGQEWRWDRLTDVQKLILRNMSIDPGAVEGRYGEEGAISAQLQAVQAELVGPTALPPEPLLRGGVAHLVLRLSPPMAPVRAVVILRAGPLYLVEQVNGSWRNTRLTDFRPEVTAAYDLTGDGRPEIFAARQDGSGAVLTLELFTWDEQQVRPILRHQGAMEPGTFGFRDQMFWIDTGVTKGYFSAEQVAHFPFLRDRLYFSWGKDEVVQMGRYRFATPFYHLNEYLYHACRGEWDFAARHLEPGAEVDGKLAQALGHGPFSGGNDTAFVNGRFGFQKGKRSFLADFGPTGRLLRLIDRQGGEALPPAPECR